MRSISLFAMVIAVALVVGCEGGFGGPASTDVQVELSFLEAPVRVGPSPVSVTLSRNDGAPLTGASVLLEGNMNHAGMKPSFATLKSADAGVYTGELQFTMGGDWFVLVQVTTDDGALVERKIDVPGVKNS